MENILLGLNIILAFILVLFILMQKSEGGALGIGVSQDNNMIIIKNRYLLIFIQFINGVNYLFTPLN